MARRRVIKDMKSKWIYANKDKLGEIDDRGALSTNMGGTGSLGSGYHEDLL